MNKCDKCGGLHWRTAPCIQRKESTAALSTERAGGAILGFETQAAGVKGNCPSVDTNAPASASKSRARQPHAEVGHNLSETIVARDDGNSGRASGAVKFNKVAYQRIYMREVYRPRLKAKREAMK